MSSRLTFKTRNKLEPVTDASETRFLGLCSGREIDIVDLESEAYLLHIKSLADGRWNIEWDDLFNAGYVLQSSSSGKLVQVCSEVAELLREHGGISIVKLVQKLQLKTVLHSDHDLRQDSSAQNMIFNAIGWLSLLYLPSKRGSLLEFRITIQSTKSATRNSATRDMASRPLDELFRSFGDLLPRKPRRPTSNGQTDTQESVLKFEVSNLNMGAMKDMANMKINWVDSISAHLEFDPTTPSISLFRCPSFCKINQSQDSIFAMYVFHIFVFINLRQSS